MAYGANVVTTSWSVSLLERSVSNPGTNSESESATGLRTKSLTGVLLWKYIDNLSTILLTATFFIVGFARSANRSSKNVDEKGRALTEFGRGEPLASLADARCYSDHSAVRDTDGFDMI